MNTKALRSKILDLAIHGKLLSEKEAAECRKGETATELLEKIRKEKEDKIAKGELKADKKSSYIFTKDCEFDEGKLGKPSEGMRHRRHYEKVFTYGKPADGTERCVEDEIPFEVPDGWAWCRLGELVSILGDGLHGTPIYNSNGNYYFVNGNNLSNGKIIIKSDTKKVDEKEFLKYKKNLNKSTILVSINGTLGNVAFYNNEKIILGKSACYFNLCNTELKEFVFSILKTTHFLKYATNNATGSTIKNVSLESMRNFLIPLPPLSEQKAIVAKIEEIFLQIDILENNKTDLQTTIKHAKSKILDLAIHGKLVPQDPNDESASKLLEKIRSDSKNATDNRRYEKMEDETFAIPYSWEWCKLGEITERIIGKTPARGKSEYWNDAKYNWVSISDMVLYKGVSKTKEKISQKAANEVFNKISPKGSLLMSFKLTVGRTCILDIPAYHNEAIITIKPYYDVNYSFRNYLLYILPIFANLGNSHDAVKGKTLNKDSIYNIFLPMPPLAEQKRIVEKIESLFLLLDKISEELN